MSAARRPVGVDGAARDPAVTFLLLLPLGLIHISGWREAGSGAFGFVLRALDALGPSASWILGLGLVVLFLWAVGRVRVLDLDWRTGALAAIAEGLIWGFVLGPILVWMTELAPIESGPLALVPVQGDWHARLALAAGAGLYEEVLFRGGLLAGLIVVLRGFFRGLGWPCGAPVLALGLALFLSSGAFAFAHSVGDPGAVEVPVLAFRFFAGIVLGLIWRWRGLAVVAWAHAAYDAFLLL